MAIIGYAAALEQFHPTRRRAVATTELAVRRMIELASSEREELLDITARVRQIVEASGVRDGLCCVYAHGATAAIMIQEYCDAFPASRHPLAAGPPGDCRHLPTLRIGALSASPAMQDMRT